ncbi:MAG TPA: hypothetical protein PJ991_09700 [Kiritimatiellia bacterium]|nr:hypothetical protein [Kiritimatiellia bacterium]
MNYRLGTKLCMLGAVAISMMMGATTKAELLVGWDLVGYPATPIPTNASSSFNHPSVQGGLIERGPGLGATGGTNGFVANSWPLPATSTLADAIASNDYFSITITAQPGATFTITNFLWRATRSGTGPSNFVLRSSQDGFTANLAAWTHAGTGNINHSNSLSMASDSNVVFRLYGFEVSGNAGSARFTDGANFGSAGIDVAFFGTATAPPNQPEVEILTTNTTVDFFTTTFDVQGTANEFVVGQLVWTNTLAAVGGTIPATDLWQIDDVPLAVGVNVINVLGTNGSGVLSQDSVSITRQASPQPAVNITTANQSVPFATTEIDIVGTANTNTVGELSWTNSLTGASGTIPATLNWIIDDVALAVGDNVITVSGSNLYAVVVQDVVTIIREVFLPPVGSDLLAFQGFEPGDSWTILDGEAHISDDTGPTNTPANARIRTGDNSWQTVGASNMLNLAEVDITGKSNVAIRVRLASISENANNGADFPDIVRFFVSLDGEEYGEPETAVRGNTNARWGYGAFLTANRIVDGSPTVTNAAPQGGTSSNNYSTVILYVPDSANSVALRIVAINDAVNEIWAIDDIELLGDEGEGGGGDDPSEPDLGEILLLGGETSVSFTSETGVNYSLQYTTDLTANPVVWTEVDGQAGTGGVITLSDDDPSDPTRVYRVVAVNAP